MSDFATARGRRAVAASILAVALIGAYFAASPGDAGASGDPGSSRWAFLVHGIVLALGFWFPAMKTSTPGDVLAAWKSLLPWLLGWILAWDLATAGIVGGRELFAEWWVVYPAGVVLFVALLLLHGTAVRRWRRRHEP